jgi:hypothetical protein
MTSSAGPRAPPIPGVSSSASHTPSGKAPAACAAASRASRVLPTPPGPVRVTSRRSGSSAISSASAVVRPTTSVSRAGKLVRARAARVTGGRHVPQARGLLEDRLVQRGDPRPGIRAEFVTEPLAQLTEAVAGRPLAAGPVQREHVRGAQPLAQRMASHQVAELTGEQAVLAERQPRLGKVLHRHQPLFLKPRDRQLSEHGVGEVGQRRSPP